MKKRNDDFFPHAKETMGDERYTKSIDKGMKKVNKINNETTKIIGFSDTHSQHQSFTLPECDIAVFAGDGNFGRLESFMSFVKWYKKQPANYKILVPGNHDFFCQDHSDHARKICKDNHIIYLEHEACEIKGIKFFGSPYTPQFFNWAFMESHEKLIYRWQQIPEDTEILITHGPAYGILDKCPESVGCRDLLNRIKLLKEQNLRYHIFGHIHTQGGKHKKIDKMNFYNVAMLNDEYRPNNKEFQVIEIKG